MINDLIIFRTQKKSNKTNISLQNKQQNLEKKLRIQIKNLSQFGGAVLFWNRIRKIVENENLRKPNQRKMDAYAALSATVPPFPSLSLNRGLTVTHSRAGTGRQ